MSQESYIYIYKCDDGGACDDCDVDVAVVEILPRLYGIAFKVYDLSNGADVLNSSYRRINFAFD